MIETATGVAFLLTSLYGVGHANTKTADMIAPSTTEHTPIVKNIDDAKQMEKYLRKQFADAPIMVEIARCESTFRQFGDNGQVIRGKVNKADVGLLQINEKYHAEDAVKLGYDIYSIEGNVSFAKYLYGKYGTSPWSSSAPCWKSSLPIAER